VQCIGATTLDEFRKYIEKDGALERRFQTIMVDPPSAEETLAILLGLRDKYEEHHRVKYTDAALECAIELSNRYINGRFLPDKAIDVVDEAGAKVRLSAMTQPPDLKEIDADIGRLETDKSEAVQQQDFERAAQLRDKAQKLKAKKRTIVEEWRAKSQEKDEVVDEEIISETVSSMTGIPLTRLEKKEAERLLQMEEKLHERVVSQHEAIVAIAKAVRRSRSGLKDPRRPMGSFIFLGPTGVGKTLLAKALARFMFGSEDALLSIDMSEYMEKHNVSRLVGAPPGYVGFEEGGQLTEKVRRRPYSVVLFDEIEKAHQDVYNMLLQIMEEGRLTDSFGRNVDFKNTIVIMTSNIGTAAIKNQATLGFQKSDEEVTYEKMKEGVLIEVEKYFKPEFLNRLDDVIVFRPLTKGNLKEIIDIELVDVRKRLEDRGIHLFLTEAAKDKIIDEGTNLDLGARPLRRAIERMIEDPLAEELLKGAFEERPNVALRVNEEGKTWFDTTEEPPTDVPPLDAPAEDEEEEAPEEVKAEG